ncbi:MAG: hypothetical protein PF569_06660 [Candidatus Woesearchaeota archaeon]|jgi:hypothetical protein|nr:hypothetical protein [Candidatus Woesearchaeota archaeon]
MHYIKDLFEKKDSEHAHNKFVRYSKGEFIGAQIKIKITKKGIKLNGSYHLVDELLTLIADYVGNRDIEIKGTLAWNQDLSPELEQIGIKHLKVKKSRGIFNYVLLNSVKFKEFVDTLKKYHLLISFKEEDVTLSTKAKLPKPNKEVSHDFCKTNFPESMKKKIMGEFAFDVKNKDAKDIIIQNQIFVDKIDLPQTENFDEARRLAKRGGKIVRTVTIDAGEPTVTEVEFYI